MSEVNPVDAIRAANDALAAAREEAKKHVSAALKTVAKTLFEAHPNVEAIRWEQYTPYFNDGDACVFSIHGVDISFNDETVGDYGEEDFYDEWSIKKAAPAVAEALNEFEGHLNEWTEHLETALGDHAQITIGRDLTVTVEEYEHD